MMYELQKIGIFFLHSNSKLSLTDLFITIIAANNILIHNKSLIIGSKVIDGKLSYGNNKEFLLIYVDPNP